MRLKAIEKQHTLLAWEKPPLPCPPLLQIPPLLVLGANKHPVHDVGDVGEVHATAGAEGEGRLMVLP
jgi:hypothetical protein